MKKLINFWFPPVVWAVVIFLFSTRPTGRASYFDWQDFIIKKIAHIIEYGVFAVLVYRALKESGVRGRNAGLWAVFIAVLYGVTDEFHQSFTPGREPRVRDVGFDTIGAVLGILATWNILPKAPKKLKVLAKRLRLI